jgi:hypothetical protein
VKRRTGGHLSQLGQDRDRGQLPDSELAQQRPAPRLATRERAQPLIQRRELSVKRVDHRHGDRDLLTRRLGQRLRRQPAAAVVGHQVAPLRTPVVIEHRLDPLLPLTALMRQGVTQPDPSAEIQHVIGRDP